jgi:pimeloyl-ACP methyl ester carboxylesterase
MPEVVTPDLQAEAYRETLDSLGIDRCCVFSFSAGSTSAVAFALRHPERVSGLVLACPNSPHPEPPNLPPRALGPILFSQPAFWAYRLLFPRGLEHLAGRPSDYPMDAEAQRDLDEVVDGFFPMGPRAAGVIYDAYIGNPAIADQPVEELSVPSLVIHAQDDPLAPYDDAKAMAERIPGSRFVSLTRGGHVLMHREDRALSEVARFLDANSDPPPNQGVET